MLRRLARNSSFPLTAIVSIALAVGANAAIFTLVDAVWFRAPPVLEPDRVVVPYRPVGNANDQELSDVLVGDVPRLLDDLEAFEAVTSELGAGEAAALWAPRIKLDGADAPLRVAVVAHNYFSTLGVDVRGRGFATDDQPAPGAAVAVISAAFWRSHFNGAEDVIGKTLGTTAGPLLIIGVAATAFEGARLGDRIDAWIPFGTLPLFSEMARAVPLRLMPVTVFGRLRHGVTLQDAQAQARSVLGQATSLHSLGGLSYRLPSEAARARQNLLLTLLAATAVTMLLLGSANLTALMMARSEGQRHAFALRLAVGATPRTLASRVAAEAALLCAGGLAAGLLLRTWVLASLAGLYLPSNLAIEALASRLDVRTLMFGGVVAVLATAVAVTGAVRAALRADLTPLLAEGAYAALGAWRVRGVLLSAHVATCVMLLAGAAALHLAVFRALRADLGLSRDQLLFVDVRPSPARYPSDKDLPIRAVDYAALLARVRALPGVQAVSYGSPFLTMQAPGQIEIVADGRAIELPLSILGGGAGYLSDAGVRFRAGRDFTAADERRMVSPRDVGLARIRAIVSRRPYQPPARIPAAIVDATFASALWASEPAVGRRFTIAHTGIGYEVIGVVDAVRSGTVGADVATMFDFRSFVTDDVIADLTLVVRAGDPDDVRPAIASVARQAFPDAVHVHVRTAHDISAAERAEEILGARIFAWFGLVSALLGSVGVFGLVAHIVARNRREIAIRAALGASTTRLRRLAAGRALAPVAVGLMAGLAFSYWASRALVATIEGLESPGMEAFGMAALLLAVSAALAALAGAAGVGRINPADLLRSKG